MCFDCIFARRENYWKKRTKLISLGASFYECREIGGCWVSGVGNEVTFNNLHNGLLLLCVSMYATKSDTRWGLN